MFIIIALAILSAAAIVWTIATLANDGYRPIRTDWTRLP